jgi:hypothetical protein
MSIETQPVKYLLSPTMPSKDPMQRRSFFNRMSSGLCGMALAHLLSQDHRGLLAAGPYNLQPKVPHQASRAKAVIHLFMNGGPSQMDLFDPKPALEEYAGKPFPGEVEEIGNQGTDQIGAIMGSPFRFARHGESGFWMSDALPHTAKVVDELCFIHSLWTDHPNHDNALYKIHSGQLFMGHPSLGSWIAYGLGSESQDLPAYVVLDDPRGLPKNGVRNWTSAFLPPVYQGTRFRTVGAPVLNLTPEYEQPLAVTRTARDLLRSLDEQHRQERPGYLELDARMEAYGLSARMQLTASDVLDLSSESAQTLEAYGIGQPTTDSYGRRCLLARRLVEKGVRFVQLFLEDQPWDNHSNLEATLRSACERTDQPTAALIRDLKQRGLLDSTLVIWGGEFGRTPTSQIVGKVASGRDHNMQAFSSWMAGGGVRPGFAYGMTDDFGHKVVEHPVSVHDFHATILHALGLDSQLLYFERNGLKERLTGLHEPRVVEEIFA